MLPQPKEKEIQFGCITPVSLLYLIPRHWKFHLLLAHLLENREYVDFYKQRQQQGDFILLDNGAFEFGKPMETHDLLGLIKQSGLTPNCVVAPDYPNQPWDYTVSSTLQFVREVKAAGFPFQIMAVPQSVAGDWEGWLKGYRAFIENPDIYMVGMSILGIPNAFKTLTGTSDILINRVFATQYILNQDLYLSPKKIIHRHDGFLSQTKWHHYLGLGQPRELILQKQLGLMDSNDSSSPVWHAVQGIRYDSSWGGLEQGKSKVPVDFETWISTDRWMEEDLRYNMATIENMIRK